MKRNICISEDHAFKLHPIFQHLKIFTSLSHILSRWQPVWLVAMKGLFAFASIFACFCFLFICCLCLDVFIILLCLLCTNFISSNSYLFFFFFEFASRLLKTVPVWAQSSDTGSWKRKFWLKKLTIRYCFKIKNNIILSFQIEWTYTSHDTFLWIFWA